MLGCTGTTRVHVSGSPTRKPPTPVHILAARIGAARGMLTAIRLPLRKKYPFQASQAWLPSTLRSPKGALRGATRRNPTQSDARPAQACVVAGLVGGDRSGPVGTSAPCPAPRP